MKEIRNAAPIVLFVYNRPEHTKKTLEHLNNAVGAQSSELFIYSDAPKNESVRDRVVEVRRILREFKDKQSVFKCCTIIEADQNRGLADSIINGVTKIIGTYGKVITLEDDLIVATDFLLYMNQALEYYQSNPQIFAISGYSFPMKSLDNYDHDVFLTGRPSSWGWATWENRWSTVDWKVMDYDEICFSLRNRIAFGKWGQDLPFMLDAYMYGYNNSWAVRWGYAASKQKKFTVYPKISRVINIGTDGSGTHFGKEMHRYDTELSSGEKECKFENLEILEPIRREFRKKYISTLGVIKWFVIWNYRKLRQKPVHEYKNNQTSSQ